MSNPPRIISIDVRYSDGLVIVFKPEELERFRQFDEAMELLDQARGVYCLPRSSLGKGAK